MEEPAPEQPAPEEDMGDRLGTPSSLWGSVGASREWLALIKRQRGRLGRGGKGVKGNTLKEEV